MRLTVIVLLRYHGRPPLFLEQRIDDAARVDRNAVIVPYGLQASDQMRRKLRSQNAIELSVAILLDDVDAIVALDERRDFGRERQSAHPHVVEFYARLTQIIARFDDGMVRRPVCEDGDLTAFLLFDD